MVSAYCIVLLMSDLIPPMTAVAPNANPIAPASPFIFVARESVGASTFAVASRTASMSAGAVLPIRV